MNLLIKNANLILENEILRSDVLISGGKITEIDKKISDVDADKIIDAEELFLSPGFIDIHVHGGGGKDFLSSNPEEIAFACQQHARFGTTSILPTLSAAPLNNMISAIKNIKKAKEISKDCNILGVFLEGPFLSQEQKGAQVPENILIPKKEYYEPLLNVWEQGVLMVGVAPEIEGAMEFGETLKKKGIVVTIAHSDATFEDVQKAINFGFSDVTHIYSGCSNVHRVNAFRVAGVVEAGLYFDELTTQVIADLKHLPISLIKFIFKCKGEDKMYLVTDGLDYSAHKLEEGTEYTQGTGNKVVYEDGVMKLLDRQAFAGSVATSSQLVKNVYKKCNIPLVKAVKMMSANPAKRLGLYHKKGKIAIGYDADLLLFDDNINIIKTFIKGREING